MKHTTFDNEKHIFSHALNGEHLVTAIVSGKEVYVATNGFQTDYPVPRDSYTLQWENPEYFSEGFKAAVHAWIISAQAMGKLPSGVEYRGPKAVDIISQDDWEDDDMSQQELTDWNQYQDASAACQY